MKKTDLLLVALAASMTLGATVSLAREGGPGRDPAAMFERLDTDGDGRITAEEIEAAGEARFAAIDTDGDAQISREEFLAHMQAGSETRAGRIFDRLDADGTGFLTRDALENRGGRRGGPARMMERLDADGDGVVTREEFDAGIERSAGRRGRHGGGFGKRSQ